MKQIQDLAQNDQADQSSTNQALPPSASTGDIANQVVKALVDTGVINKQVNTAADRRSAFQEAMDKLKSNPESDPAAVAGTQILFEAFEKDLTSRQRQEAAVAMKNVRDQAALNLIDMMIDTQMGADKALKDYSDVVKGKVLNEVNTNPTYAPLLKRYAETGEIDNTTLKKLIGSEVGKLQALRGEGRSPKTNATMNEGNVTTKSQSIVKDAKDGDGDDGDDSGEEKPRGLYSREHYSKLGLRNEFEPETSQERDLYNSRLGTAQRNNWRKDSKEAIQYARQGVKNLRGGRQKAKEAGLPAMAGFMPDRWR